MSRNFRLYTINTFLDFPLFLYYLIYLFCFVFFPWLISIFLLEVFNQPHQT